MLSPMDPTVNSTDSSASTDYRKKRIKNVQKLELVRLMKANFLFIRGKHAVARSEKSRADVWKVITARLNSLGPPVQSAEAWQRRWNDMRSATKSKMAKIQSYVREHGEDCPYKLNLVERLIWDTFSVKPEEYMKDLNMKLWREKQQKCVGTPVGQPSASDSVSSCSSQMSAEQSFDMGWTQVGTTCHDTGAGWNSTLSFAGRETSGVMEDLNRTTAFYPTSSSNQPEQSYGTHQSVEMGYAGYSGTSTNNALHQRNMEATNQWTSSSTGTSLDEHAKMIGGSTDLVPGSKVLRELNKLFDLVLKQNEEILALLRQPINEQENRV
uniref:Regulatory protein zeste n=1 Tax=Anopheles christyi TaxID=43041 RepID=A0A182K0U2_9DIPT